MSGHNVHVKKILISVAIAAIIITGGCVQSGPSSPAATESTTQRELTVSGGEATQQALVQISPYPLDSSSEQFAKSVLVSVRIRGYPPQQFENTRLCLYDEGGTVLSNESLGPIVSPETGEFVTSYSVNVTLSQRPKYILIDHPELRNNNWMTVEMLEWNSTRNLWIPRDSPGLPIANWPRTNETGQCG
jgi:hypothetical protein